MDFPPIRRSRGAYLHSAFTIFELLVVMGILSILAAIVIPLSSRSKHDAKRISRDLIRAHLQQTRAHAIASRNPTALLIANRNTSAGKPDSMSFIEVQSEDGKYIASDPPKLLKKWTALPENWRFLCKQDFLTEHPTVIDFEKTLIIEDHLGETECHLIVFAQNGRMVYPPSGSAIHIAIGHADLLSDYDVLRVNRLTAQARRIKP